MIVRTIRVPYKYGETITLLPISDIHYGNKTCDKRKLKADLAAMGDNTYIIGVGDWLDMILVKDAKRYRKEHDDSPSGAIIDDQIGGLFDILKPYAKRILALGDGNHEEKMVEMCGTNPIERLCKMLSIDGHHVYYMGYSWLVNLRLSEDGNRTRTIAIRGHHGWGGGSRTEGADITKFSHDVKFWRADLFLYGHVHKLKINDVEEGRVIGDSSWKTFVKRMLVCGTYQRTYSNTTTATYAEKCGFPPTSIRHPKVEITPNGTDYTMKVII